MHIEWTILILCVSIPTLGHQNFDYIYNSATINVSIMKCMKVAQNVITDNTKQNGHMPVLVTGHWSFMCRAPGSILND
jgi:hypothetical protein